MIADWNDLILRQITPLADQAEQTTVVKISLNSFDVFVFL